MVGFEDAERVVTHAGEAHRDEFLAVSLVLACNPRLPVERRVATDADLNDPAVIVLDQGGLHDPERSDFDHHQVSRDAAPVCALSLVLQHLGTLALARRIWPWLPWTEIVDTQGPREFARRFWAEMCSRRGTASAPNQAALTGITTTVLSTVSPIEQAVLRAFAAETTIQRGEPLHALLVDVGKDLLWHLEGIEERLSLLDATITIHEVEGLKVIRSPAVAGGDQPILGLELWLTERGHADAAIVVVRDDRGPGWTLFRRHDHPAVDFARVHGAPGVAFAHRNGFVAKTTLNADLDVLLRRAVTTGPTGGPCPP